MRSPYEMDPIRESARSWQERAECLKYDPELFFHPEGEYGEERTGRQEKAKAICAVCPVQKPCHERAMSNGERDGVWAGVVHAIGKSRANLKRDRERFIRAVARGKYRKPTEKLPPIAPTTKRRKEYRAKEDRRKELEAMLQSPEWHEMEATLNV